MDCLITGVRVRAERRVHKRGSVHKEVSAVVLSDSREHISAVSYNFLRELYKKNDQTISTVEVVECAYGITNWL